MTDCQMWGSRPYHSLDYEMKHRFGEKIYKVALDAGMTCPNRDGTLDTRGCSFCSGSGSGEFAIPKSHQRTFPDGSLLHTREPSSVTEQINNGIRFVSSQKQTGCHYIAYFQSFTNTYAPVEILKPLYREALDHPDIVMLSIATRPDCLPDDVITLLQECNQIKPVMIELGLQSIHEQTALHIRRGYPTAVYDTAVESLKNAGLEVVTHVIAGLPGESKNDFLQTVEHVGKCGSDGIKLQLLHVLKGTDLSLEYKNRKFSVLTMEEYLDWITSAIQILPKEIVIHRLTGDGARDLLTAPLWSRNKRHVLNSLHKKMKAEHIYQGQKAELVLE